MFFTLHILLLEFYMSGANHIAGVVRHGETAFPAHFVAVPVSDLRVDEHQVAMIGHRLAGDRAVHDGDALEMTNLGRSNTNGTGAMLPCQLQLRDKATQAVIETGYRL